MTPEEEYEEYRLNNTQKMYYGVLTIKHSQLSKDWHMCPEFGGNFTFDDGSVVAVEQYNIATNNSSSKDDLDEDYNFTIQDNNGLIQRELALIDLESEENAIIERRLFDAEDLTAQIYPTQITYSADISHGTQISSIKSIATPLGANRTGEQATNERFPMQS